MSNTQKDYPTWEFGGIIKKAEVITYILSVMKDDLPVTGMEIVRQAESINWSISFTHVYNILKNLERQDHKGEHSSVLSSRWLNDSCRERIYDIIPLVGQSFLKHANQTMMERIDQVKHLIRTIDNSIRIDSNIVPALLPTNKEILSVRDLYRLSILTYTLFNLPLQSQIKQGAFGLRINKAHYRLQAEWLNNNGYLDPQYTKLTPAGEVYLNQIRSHILAQVPLAKQRMNDLLQYPKIYERNRKTKQR